MNYILLAFFILISTNALAYLGWESGSTSSGGQTITCADGGVIFAQGANTPRCASTHFYFDYSGNILHVDSVQTLATSVPQTDFYPSLSGDTHWIWGVSGDGGNTNNDHIVLSEGTTLGSSNRIDVAPGGLVTIANAAITAINATSGNVGIGTATPTKTLDVFGTARATAFVGDGSGLTGVVGASNYWITGNVGIGTTNNVGISSVNPGQKLDVVGTVRATAFVGDGTGITGISGSGTVNGGTTNQLPRYAATGTALTGMTNFIYDGANVGIGTSVVGGVGRMLLLDSADNPTPLTLQAGVTGGNANTKTVSLSFQTTSNDDNPAASVRGGMETDAHSTASYLSFITRNAAGTVAEKMRVGSANIGIGTTVPGQTLDVTGTIRASAATPLIFLSCKASSGTRYLCVDTSGNVSCSATACSGT